MLLYLWTKKLFNMYNEFHRFRLRYSEMIIFELILNFGITRTHKFSWRTTCIPRTTCLRSLCLLLVTSLYFVRFSISARNNSNYKFWRKKPQILTFHVDEMWKKYNQKSWFHFQKRKKKENCNEQIKNKNTFVMLK